MTLTKGEIGKTYNIGSQHEYSVNEIYDKLKNITGRGTAEYVKDPRAFNDSRYCIDSSELRKLGWSETLDFDSKLRETIQWYQDHPDWYK
jgi:dTDP-glucose 4,6-dehydratase